MRRTVTPRHEGERGSTLVAVMIIMLVLTIGALVLSTIVLNTTGMVSATKSTAQSRAAADAGLTAALVRADRGGGFCPASNPTVFAEFVESDSVPEYTVRSRCDNGRAYFESVGRGPGDSATATLVEHEYIDATDPTGGLGELIFFSHAQFSGELRINASADLLSIIMPSGDFTCRTTLPANVIVRGNVTGNGSCRIQGDVYGGGSLTVNGSDVFEGNVTTAGTSVANIQGRILGDIHVGGGIDFGWSGFTYPGNVSVGGNVNLASISIAKRLKIPTGFTAQKDGWINITSPTVSDARIAGGIEWLAAREPMPEVTFDPWFEFTYHPAEWPGFNNVIALNAAGNGPGTCNYFNANDPQNGGAQGWRDLGNIAVPTVIDARACSELKSNNGSHPDVAIKTDILFLAKSYDLNSLTLTAVPGFTPRLWWVVEDRVDNGAPSCSSGAGNITIEKTSIAAPIVSMAYTPCTVNVTGSTNSSKWTGSFYGGGFNYGGGLQFTGDRSIGLPGMLSGEDQVGGVAHDTIGAIVSRHDIPVPAPTPSASAG